MMPQEAEIALARSAAPNKNGLVTRNHQNIHHVRIQGRRRG